MKLHIRGHKSYFIECGENETMADIKVKLRELEGDIMELNWNGIPVNDQIRVNGLPTPTLDLYLNLHGSKVHASLARAGKVRAQTPKVEKQEKKKKKTGRAKKRVQFIRVPANIL
ncbi:ubiquitin-like FUBI-ribosomal protein eS30 fusion protein [Phymastichus coffea]|uniref:ubiquitin-like FUBI-ribosomal protein eS30 fusion protein n=1 Tax=Phymastichus coffea TaxID=108790 RepID=UPI00273C8475|nr:ubiquitin-like FUBI-ribosomal protein eS30 fusion protein [Phymastichus coffea]XP_058796879.1 ubiquitin-like FUBI-ribosomal protein eS30 fusion protein [Phymastichus coffea]